MDFGQINLGEQYTKTLAITNTNPIEIPLLYYFSELDSISVVFDEIATDDSMVTLAEYGQLHPHSSKYAPVDVPEDADELEIVLQPGHTAKFTVTVETDSKSRVQGEVLFGSPYQVLHVPVHYRALKHSLMISPKSITFAPVSPGQLLDPARRKSSKIKHLIPLEQKRISMKPKDRLEDITNVYSDDPRLIIQRVNVDGAEANSVTLAMVSFDPTMGSWADNYAPQISSTAMARSASSPGTSSPRSRGPRPPASGSGSRRRPTCRPRSSSTRPAPRPTRQRSRARSSRSSCACRRA